MIRLLATLFVVTVLLTPALAKAPVNLLQEGNYRELRAWGAKAGAVGLAIPLSSSNRLEVLAALHASAGADDSWALLGMLAHKAAHPDRSLAVVASQGAAQIAHELDLFTIEQQEIPTRNLRLWQQAWVKLAKAEGRWGDIRIYALETAARLAQLTNEPIPWKVFFAAEDPEIRAAAIMLSPRRRKLEVQVVALLADAEAPVALSAGQWLCGPLGSVEKRKTKVPSPKLAARFQQLATNQQLSIGARADLAGCLLSEGGVESRRALALLLQQSPPALRRTLAALIQEQRSSNE